jgi:mono/diheme cytochrome c family protein
MNVLKVLCCGGWLTLSFGMTASAQTPDIGRGRALYENHCQVCHTGKVHSRLNRIVLDRKDIAEIVDRWQAQQNLRWSTQELDDVVEYLARQVYKIE